MGSRLKRLGERFLTEVARVYRTAGIDFEPSWFPVFFLLDREETVQISQFAEELVITQSGATQLIKGLEKKGLLEEIQAKGRDRRTKSVRFTSRGRELLEQVRPVWRALTLSMEALLAEGPNSKHFLPALAELEDGFDTAPLCDRVLRELTRQQLLGGITMESWSRRRDEAYREALLEWLTLSSGTASSEEEKMLQNPGGHSPDRELLLLLWSTGEVMGFCIHHRVPDPRISALFLRSAWNRCGAEELFLTRLEARSSPDRPPTLTFHRNQTPLLAAARERDYNLLSWEGDLITLRRKP